MGRRTTKRKTQNNYRLMAYTGQLTGNLGRDPEIKFFENGKTVANFSLAVKQWKKDAPARWIKVSVWGTTAQYVSDYVKKGDKVALFGRVEPSETYTDKQGSARVQEKFTATDVEKFSERQPESDPYPSRQTGQGEGCPMPQKLQATHAQLSGEAAGTPSSVSVDSDDIPF